MRRRVRRRVVLGTRESPTRVMLWARSSERAGHGVGSGLGKYGTRVVRPDRTWSNSSVRRRVRRRVVLRTRDSPTPVRRWGESSARARTGGGREFWRSAVHLMLSRLVLRLL